MKPLDILLEMPFMAALPAGAAAARKIVGLSGLDNATVAGLSTALLGVRHRDEIARKFRKLTNNETMKDHLHNIKDHIAEHPKAYAAGAGLIGAGVAAHKYIKSRKKKK